MRQRRSGGFTLVELLVVIGIIALLISVLLPALSSARRSANKVRCQAQLREIGNALGLYAADNKGFWPVVRHEADNAFPPPPASASLRNPVPRNDYWYMFLLKYYSRRLYDGAAGKRLAAYQNTPLWGCPVVSKYDADVSGSSADFNSGYGMGPYAAYTESTYAGINSILPAPQERGSHWAMISQSSGDLRGKYYKQTGWLRPAAKAIIADSRSWFMETRTVASEAAIVHPANEAAMGYDSAASHQFDRFRHSPKRAKKGATLSMNFLFCDGHVGEITDIKEAFKAMRGKFPL